MLNIIYLILTITVAIYGIMSGFRRGITGEIASILGFAFGVVATRLLTQEGLPYFEWVETFSQDPVFSEYSRNLVCAVTIFIAVYFFVYLIGCMLKLFLSWIEKGIINRMAGALFSLVNNLLLLSICFNLALFFIPSSQLLKYERAGDGNLVSAVMAMTPVFLGCYGAEDFAHFNQLKEAKSISCNFNAKETVILTQG